MINVYTGVDGKPVAAATVIDVVVPLMSAVSVVRRATDE
jgi:hypothetical protein